MISKAFFSRLSLSLAGMIFVLTSLAPGTFAQEGTSSQSALIKQWLEINGQIIEKVGSKSGTVTKEQFAQYILERLFAGIDSYKDGQIDDLEYAASHLYIWRQSAQEKWQAEPDRSDDLWQSDVKNADCKGGELCLTPANLYKVNAWWHSLVDSATEKQWKKSVELALKHKPSDQELANCVLSKQDVARYLQAEVVRLFHPVSVDDQMDFLKGIQGDTGDVVTMAQFVQMRNHFRFRQMDLDGNDALDLQEFTKAVPTPGAFKEFTVTLDINKDLLISETEFPVGSLSGSSLATRLRREAEDYWNKVVGEYSAPTALVRTSLTTRTKQDLTTVRLVMGPGITNKGIVLKGDRRINAKGEVEVNPDESNVVLRIIKKFTDSEATAAPATINFARSIGKEREESVLGALRLEFQNPRARQQLAAGLEVERSGTGESRTDVRRYYLQGKKVFRLKNSTHAIYFGPVYETDLKNDVNKITGVFLWEPTVKVFGFPSGVWLPPTRLRKGPIKILFLPRFGAEIGEVTRGESETGHDRSFARFELQSGISMFSDRLGLVHTWYYRKALNGGNEDHAYSDVSLSFAFDQDKHYSLSGSYKRGEDSPAFTYVRQYSVGLGIKY